MKGFTNYNATVELQKDESYIVVLNSNYSTDPANRASATFNFDWSVLPDRNYEVHFSFNSQPMNLSSNVQPICMIHSDIFSASNTYVAGSQASWNGSQTSNFIGVAYPYVLGTNSFLHAEDGTCPPIYLNTPPRNNQFTVSLLTNENPQTEWAPIAGGTLQPWVLLLRFVPVDKSNRVNM